MSEIILIDLSSVLHPIWHTSQSEPDVNATSTRTVARVRALTAGHPFAAICCDKGPYFRKDVDPTYKASRPEQDAALYHQMDRAKELLAGDGYPVWGVKGFEADDLCASAVKWASGTEHSVMIVSSDKDLLALVGPRVCVMSARNGQVYDEPAVIAKLGVRADQVTDYLCLVGDSSDNVKGANKIGEKKAAAILTTFGSIAAVFTELEENGTIGLTKRGLKPAEIESLVEFHDRYPTVRKLIEMRSDVVLPFDDVVSDRISRETGTFATEGEKMGIDDVIDAEVPPDTKTADMFADKAPGSDKTPDTPATAPKPAETMAIVAVEWQRQLDPRSMAEARTLAKDLFDSRMFSAYGSPQAVLSTMMVGRELGVPAMASLRSIHNIQGRHALSAALMAALILKSGFAEYFRPVTFGDKEATFETLRKGSGNKPVQLTHTIEMAKTAGLVKPDSNWIKIPTDMLASRAQSRLARMVYPDLLAGLYTPDELEELKYPN